MSKKTEKQKSRKIGYAEAAELLGIQPATLYSLVRRGRIPHIRYSDRLVRFDLAALVAWQEQRTVEVG